MIIQEKAKYICTQFCFVPKQNYIHISLFPMAVEGGCFFNKANVLEHAFLLKLKLHEIPWQVFIVKFGFFQFNYGVESRLQ